MAARSSSAHLVAGLVLTVLSAGCTPTVNRLQPYRDDPVQARELAERANELCRQQCGPSGLPPHRFTTDGCSLWPDGSWVSCCVDHDMAYWCGGSCEDRAHADATLRQCVAEHGPVGMGTTMYVGVRIGAPPWYPFPFRWGYGWDWPHGYGCLQGDGSAGQPGAPP